MTEIERMMKLLAEVTGWSDQCLSVETGYKRRRQQLSQDESTIVDGDWGWVVSTTICGTGELKVSAQGETLEEALRNLAASIPHTLCERASRYTSHAQRATELVAKSI